MNKTATQQTATPEVPVLPGMLPPRAAREDLSRWEDEGGKPAVSVAEKQSREAAECALRREQRVDRLKGAMCTVRDFIRANPMLATVGGIVLGLKLGRLLSR